MHRMVSFPASIVLVLAVLWGPSNGIAQDRDAALLVGTKKCKMCHKKEEKGNQFQKWLDGPHAKAFEALGSDEAKAAGATLGIEDPQASGKCLKCHSTAYNFTEKLQTEAVLVTDGVSCESCHGPGKNYKKKETMQDRKASIAAGMIHPAAEHCEKCHNEENPTWDPEKYTLADGTKSGFDVEQAYEKIKHPNPNVTHD